MNTITQQSRSIHAVLTQHSRSTHAALWYSALPSLTLFSLLTPYLLLTSFPPHFLLSLLTLFFNEYNLAATTDISGTDATCLGPACDMATNERRADIGLATLARCIKRREKGEIRRGVGRYHYLVFSSLLSVFSFFSFPSAFLYIFLYILFDVQKMI